MPDPGPLTSSMSIFNTLKTYAGGTDFVTAFCALGNDSPLLIKRLDEFEGQITIGTTTSGGAQFDGSNIVIDSRLLPTDPTTGKTTLNNTTETVWNYLGKSATTTLVGYLIGLVAHEVAHATDTNYSKTSGGGAAAIVNGLEGEGRAYYTNYEVAKQMTQASGVPILWDMPKIAAAESIVTASNASDQAIVDGLAGLVATGFAIDPKTGYNYIEYYNGGPTLATGGFLSGLFGSAGASIALGDTALQNPKNQPVTFYTVNGKTVVKIMEINGVSESFSANYNPVSDIGPRSSNDSSIIDFASNNNDEMSVAWNTETGQVTATIGDPISFHLDTLGDLEVVNVGTTGVAISVTDGEGNVEGTIGIKERGAGATIASDIVGLHLSLGNDEETVSAIGAGSEINAGQGLDTFDFSEAALIVGAKSTDQIMLGSEVLHGGIEWQGSQSGLAVGSDNTEYGKDVDGELVIIPPNADPNNPIPDEMFVANYQGGPNSPTDTAGIYIGAASSRAYHITDPALPSNWLQDQFEFVNGIYKAMYGLAFYSGVDPLVLDLTGAGINLTDTSSQAPLFDMNGTGFAVRTGWVEPNVGILVRLSGGADGQTDNISAFVGSQGQSGFAALASYDSNGDGVIDQSDPIYAQLGVWVDANGNGIDPKRVWVVPREQFSCHSGAGKAGTRNL